MVLIFNLTISDISFALFLVTHTTLVRRILTINSRMSRHYTDIQTMHKMIEMYTETHTTMTIFEGLAYRLSFWVSLLTHIAIAFDRLYCVIRPIKYRHYKKRKYMIVTSIVIWIVAIIITGLHLFWRFKEELSISFVECPEFYIFVITPVLISMLIILIYGFIIWMYKTNNQNQ